MLLITLYAHLKDGKNLFFSFHSVEEAKQQVEYLLCFKPILKSFQMVAPGMPTGHWEY